MKRFLIDKNYGDYLSKMGFSLEAVLKKAMLPEDLFSWRTPSLTAEEYFRFMQAVDALSPSAQTLICLASSEGIEAFSPPVFAAYYSLELPEILVGIEFAFLVGLIRRATREPVAPLFATVKRPMKNGACVDFIGIPVTAGDKNRLVFSKADMLIPFISRNESMWAFFEPELNRRLSMMETDDSCAARVRSALMELLPAGECSIDDAARKLGVSRRSLQRRLQEENTSFQKQLNHTQELLAKTYLANTDMTGEDITFLLGYQEVGSFHRAFSVWTGRMIGVYRKIERALRPD